MIPSVKIIVLNWNGKDLTVQCLESLSKLTYQNSSILLVDNCSVDNTVDTVRTQFPKVGILDLDQNYGYAEGNNRGFESLKENPSDFVCFLNNDTIVAPDFIDNLVDASTKFGKNNIYGPKIFYADKPNLIWFAGGVVKFPFNIYHKGIRKIDCVEYSEEVLTDYITGCCLFTSWETVNRLNGFDKSFGMYSEDVDLCLRAKKVGLQSYFIPSSKIWHKVSASLGGAFTFRKIFRRIKSNLKLYFKHR